MVANRDDEERTVIATGSTKPSVKIDDAPPTLVVLMGPTGYVGRQFALTEAELVIGRAIESQIYIDDKSVSRAHAKVLLQNTEVFIIDNASSNKTFLNGKAIEPMQAVKLANNDQIKTGNVIFKFLEKGNIEALANKELVDKAQKDALTGAFSKGALLEKGPEAIKRSEFLNEPLSVLVFDIDHFKKINDTYGHAAGDYVLKELSHLILSSLVRANDYFARYGGEEFVILLAGSPLKNATEVAERIRTTVQAHSFKYDQQVIPVTISMGVAFRGPEELDWGKLFKRADESLYKSKQGGRNRVTVAT